MRVAQNLGVTMGPVIGGLLLLGENWTRLFVGVAAMLVVAVVVGWRLLPSRGAYSPDKPPERGSFGVIRRDHAFLLFLISGALAYLVYVAYETVLPISAVDTHGLSPSTWGFLVIINPALVTLFQLRLTRRVSHIPAGPKLVVAMLLMGFPFLLLSTNASIPMFAFVIAVFVLGRDALGADLAGDRRRPRAGGRARRLHGRLRQHRGDRLRARPVRGPPVPRALGRHAPCGASSPPSRSPLRSPARSRWRSRSARDGRPWRICAAATVRRLTPCRR